MNARESFRSEARALLAETGIGTRVALRWRKPTVYFQLQLRKTEWLSSRSDRSPMARVRYLVQRFRYERLSQALGVTIPLHTFGPRLSIAHLPGIVVNGSARIGSDCRIHQGVTIGAVRGKAPTIGDGVFIGPNAVVLGPITIGDGAHISAGVVVTESVPSRSVVYPHRPEVAPDVAQDWKTGV